jgi:hypothetical protein
LSNLDEVVKQDREEALKALEAATPGRWYWEGFTKDKSASLITTRFGHRTIMDFVRWGMDSASPRFHTEDGMKRLDAPGMVTYRQEHRENHFYTINHPDAYLIANAPEWLRNALERERLLAEEVVQLKNSVRYWQDDAKESASHATRVAAKVYEQDKELQELRKPVVIPDEVLANIKDLRSGACDKEVMEIAAADYDVHRYKIMQNFARSNFEVFLKYIASTCDVSTITYDGVDPDAQ